MANEARGFHGELLAGGRPTAALLVLMGPDGLFPEGSSDPICKAHAEECGHSVEGSTPVS